MSVENKDAIVGLKELSDHSFDVIICDCPYNIGKDFGICKDDKSLVEYVEWCMIWIAECERVMNETATLYIYGFPEILCFIAVNLKLNFKYLVWHYKNKTVPSLKFWQRSHESILCCWKSERIFNLDAVREPYSDVFLKNAAGKVRKATKGRYSHGGKETIYAANENGALPRDLLECPAMAGGAGTKQWVLCKTCDEVYTSKEIKNHDGHEVVKHPTQKPYELTKRLLLAAKPKEGGKVLIPFVGSGSECAVAMDLGMEYLGFEINEDYVRLANGFLKNRKKIDN